MMNAVAGALLVVLSAALGARSEPVVLTGAQLPALCGQRPQRIVAYAFRGGWRRIPVQVDERAEIPFSQVLRRRVQRDLKGLFYTDPDTFTGPDPRPEFDADDELVVLAEDAAGPAPAEDPPGVDGKTRVQVTLQGLPDTSAHVYLFASTTAPAPLEPRVRYEFRLEKGKYKSDYKLQRGPNPERSTVTTPAYRLGFSDRWQLDELRLTVGDVPGVDILDMHKVQVFPGSCIRTTKTFSDGAGAIIANISGPLRAIRSVIGANSGPLTERKWICYPRRFEIVTHLRVHPLPSVLMFFDYSAEAVGMRYHDNLNPAGFPIDGKADPAVIGKLHWQLVTGRQGSLCIHFLLDSDLPNLVEGSLYDDNLTPKWSQCTGDGHAFGAAGPLLRNLGNTDPRSGRSGHLTSRLVIYPGPADQKPDPTGISRPRTPEVLIR